MNTSRFYKFATRLLASLLLTTSLAVQAEEVPMNDGEHADASERLITVMRQLFSVVHEDELGSETTITQDQMTDLVESVEELVFFAEVMSTRVPATELEETEAVIFSALADRLYDEALNVKQLASNYNDHVIDTSQKRLFNEAYHRLNKTCNACHQTFRD